MLDVYAFKKSSKKDVREKKQLKDQLCYLLKS